MSDFLAALDAIDALGSLPPGWDYGRDGPATPRARAAARSAARTLRDSGAGDYEVVPGDDGGVSLFAYRANESIELHFTNRGEMEHFDATNRKFARYPTELGLGLILESLGWRSPRLFVSCTQNATFQKSVDTPAHRFVIHQAKGAFRLSARNVWSGQARRYALTSGSTIPSDCQENRQFSGGYREIRSERALS